MLFRQFFVVTTVVILATACSIEPAIQENVPLTTLLTSTSTTTLATVPVVPATVVDPPTPMVTEVANEPSQSPEDATRMGVVAAVAELSFGQRVKALAEVSVPGGTWVPSKLSDEVVRASVADGQGCALGDVSGQQLVDFICTGEYGELLFLDTAGNIGFAVPMPGQKPSWVHVSEQIVYAGHVGDGGLPSSGVVRVDTSTVPWETTALWIDHPFEPRELIAPGWCLPTVEHEAFNELVGFEVVGVAVTSWIGEIKVDLVGLDALFEETVSAGC